MKVVLIADTHFTNKVGYGGINPKTGLCVRFEKQLESFQKVVDYCINNNVEQLIHLGDMFDSSNPSVVELYEVLICFHTLSLSVDKITILAGNHDISNMYSLEWLNIFNHPKYKVYSDFEQDDNFIYAPWIKGSIHEKLQQYISCNNVNNKILLGHFSVSGVKLGVDDTIILDHEDMIPADLLSVFNHSYLGHIHKRQILANNVEYIGSLLPHNFGEREEQKGFVVLDI